MTEVEWLACTDPRRMVAFLRGKTGDRKLRLFACACCRSVWHSLSDRRNRHAVEVAESFADGLPDARQLAAANEASYGVYANTSAPGSGFADAAVEISRNSWEAAQAATIAAMPYTDPEDPVRSALIAAEQSQLAASWSAVENHPPGAIADYAQRTAEAAERASQADLVREIIGNPFRPVTMSPAWQTSTILSLAQSAYDDRSLPSGHLDPDRLAVLADALEEAGCADADLLGHLRSPGPHVRGCWALDLLLNKE